MNQDICLVLFPFFNFKVVAFHQNVISLLSQCFLPQNELIFCFLSFVLTRSDSFDGGRRGESHSNPEEKLNWVTWLVQNALNVRGNLNRKLTLTYEHLSLGKLSSFVFLCFYF